MVKPLWNSKTFWFGLLTALCGVAAIFYPPAAQLMSKYADALSIGWGALAVVLRLVTKDKVSLIG